MLFLTQHLLWMRAFLFPLVSSQSNSVRIHSHPINKMIRHLSKGYFCRNVPYSRSISHKMLHFFTNQEIVSVKKIINPVKVIIMPRNRGINDRNTLNIERNAVSVFPDPVGAETKTFCLGLF